MIGNLSENTPIDAPVVRIMKKEPRIINIILAPSLKKRGDSMVRSFAQKDSENLLHKKIVKKTQ